MCDERCYYWIPILEDLKTPSSRGTQGSCCSTLENSQGSGSGDSREYPPWTPAESVLLKFDPYREPGHVLPRVPGLYGSVDPSWLMLECLMARLARIPLGERLRITYYAFDDEALSDDGLSSCYSSDCCLSDCCSRNCYSDTHSPNEVGSVQEEEEVPGSLSDPGSPQSEAEVAVASTGTHHRSSIVSILAQQ